jgi:betaine-aldehyde dehydrogenase
MATTMGALVDQAQYQRSLSYVDLARAEGARVVTGGQRPPGLARGFFLEPTVLDRVEPAHRVAREEIFGPVLSVMRWRDEAQMLRMANGVDFGLTASVWTQDLVTAHRAAASQQAGYVWINDCSIHLPGAPFGGYKLSGAGREECLQEMHEFTQVKNVNLSLRRRA